MMALHLGLSAVIGLVYWYHIRRLNRPKWLPPRFWLALVGAPLLLAAIIVPLGMLPPLDPLRLPGPVNLDAFYLFYLPAALRWPPLPLWGGLAIVLALSAALPVASGSSADAARRSELRSLYRLHFVRSRLPLQSDHDEAARGGRQIQVSGRGRPEAVRRVRHLHRRM